MKLCDICNKSVDVDSKQVDVHVLLDKETDICSSCKKLLKEAINDRIDAIREGLVLNVK
jgi:hypothetical protein